MRFWANPPAGPKPICGVPSTTLRAEAGGNHRKTESTASAHLHHVVAFDFVAQFLRVLGLAHGDAMYFLV